jgi:hypothetical protein
VLFYCLPEAVLAENDWLRRSTVKYIDWATLYFRRKTMAHRPSKKTKKLMFSLT